MQNAKTAREFVFDRRLQTLSLLVFLPPLLVFFTNNKPNNKDYKYSSARFYYKNEKDWDFLVHVDGWIGMSRMLVKNTNMSVHQIWYGRKCLTADKQNHVYQLSK